MYYDSCLSFSIELLKRLNISTHIFDKTIPTSVDAGLRAMIFKKNNYSELLLNSPSEAKNNTIYHFFDEYRCNYFFLKLPNDQIEQFFYVGPYISGIPSDNFIELKSKQLNLNDEDKSHFKNYYYTLPIIEDENVLMTIINTLGNFIWKDSKNYCIEYINYEIADQLRPVNYSTFSDNLVSEQNITLESIEHNYENEKLLIEVISKGKLNKLNLITSTGLTEGIEQRLSDSLRNRKNYLIILNTLLRKAAELGEVHPFHIHKLSSKYAIKIEKITSINQSLELQKEMIKKYCMLVKENSLEKYSPLIKKVMTLISYDISSDLTLNSISSTLNVNASYLSATFKKECGETLTSFVNRKRMETAAYLLSHTDEQIQHISLKCGIYDVNYFIKLFKKQYGTTPTEYKNKIII